MSLIDRDALIADYDRLHIGAPGKARDLISEAPEVDAIPVSLIRSHLDFLKNLEAKAVSNRSWHFAHDLRERIYTVETLIEMWEERKRYGTID